MRFRTLLVACVASAASALAYALYARVEWPWLVCGWIGLVPWLAVLDRTRTHRGALAAGLLMCEAFVLAVFAWLPSAIQNYTGAPWVVALLVVLLIAPVLQPQFLALALARSLARRSGRAAGWTSLVSACAYAGSEWALPKLFADTLGHGLYASQLLRQAADLGGAHGLTFVLIITNEWTFRALQAMRARSRPPRPSLLAPTACIAALVLTLLAYGALRLQSFEAAHGSVARVTAGLVQADISQYGRLAAEMGTYDATRMILDTHLALSAEALARAPLDLLIWPETVYPTTFGSPKSADGAAFDREIAAFAVGAGVSLVFGAYEAEGEDEFNAAFFVQPTADSRVTVATYRKALPFPLTEYVPAVLESDAVRRRLPWLGTWKRGSGGQVVPVVLRDGRMLRVAPLICYDAIFPGDAIAAVRRGAEVIVTLSNDSWFSYGNVPRLILTLSAFRSIETRRPQLRATNTGISAVITPTGDLIETIGVHERGSLVASVRPEASATTLMLAWGDWFGPTALVVGVGLLIAPLARRQPGFTPRR